jgi:VIT1/CCC1 family predicted Fe2+/Mn2+ transporter
VSTQSPDAYQIGHEHPDVTGGWLRPTVFGVSDGLVSNVALVAGVAGGTRGDSSAAVVLAGLAGLAAGAFSMAVGEYVSVASQSESAAREVEKERREILANPEAETRELAQMYRRKGLDETLAYEVARQIHSDVDTAVEVHAREELGVDPHELASPALAAASSFLAFALGALVPLLPYLFGADTIWPGLLMTLVALFGTGAMVTARTTRTWMYGGARQMLLGAAAAALTYGIGSLVGAQLG